MTDSIHYSPASLNRSYAAPEIVHQRARTLEALDIQQGEAALDVGCGSGFLSEEFCRRVGDGGRVIAIDKSAEMVDAARARCAGHTEFSAREGNVTLLEFSGQTFDLVACTQVLLYVADVEQAIKEMVRVLKPGGRLAILETDWRTAVMRTSHEDLTRAIYDAWDATVPSPNLPVRLKKLMQNAGIENIHVEGIPLVNTEFDTANFSVGSLDWLSGNAYKQGAISKEESKLWRDDLAALGQNGEYFFCVNRFLFCGSKAS